MTCYRPLQAFQSKFPNEKGKFPVIFKYSPTLVPIELPCGQCIGCRLDYSVNWAIRCMHEASLHEENCFITLTYDDEHLPYGDTLVKKDFQDFMKRLRKYIYPWKVRFFQCGEYGENFGRPHYHAILFGIDFDDKVLVSQRDGIRLYTSKILESLWTFGFSSVGAVTFDSAAYVARYATKKITGDAAEDHYDRIDKDTGEVFTKIREYANMSRKPGVGRLWFDKYGERIYNEDFLVTPSGAKIKPPRYYDSLYEHIYPSDLMQIKQDRKNTAMRFADNNMPDRLSVREYIQNVKYEMLPRLLK